MPGPKYGDFKFPRSFGFTGSAGDRVPIRGHERRPPVRMQRGGRAKKEAPDEVRPSMEQIGQAFREASPTRENPLTFETLSRRAREIAARSNPRFPDAEAKKLSKALGGPVRARGGGSVRKNVRQSVQVRKHGVRPRKK